MTEYAIRPVIGFQEIKCVVERLAAIWQASVECPHVSADDEIVGITRAADITPDLRSRMDYVESRRSGLNWAAWCIGETLAACGGLVLMQIVCDELEDLHGPRAASWLDHRWDGVEIPDGGIWVA